MSAGDRLKTKIAYANPPLTNDFPVLNQLYSVGLISGLFSEFSHSGFLLQLSRRDFLVSSHDNLNRYRSYVRCAFNPAAHRVICRPVLETINHRRLQHIPISEWVCKSIRQIMRRPRAQTSAHAAHRRDQTAFVKAMICICDPAVLYQHHKCRSQHLPPPSIVYILYIAGKR